MLNWHVKIFRSEVKTQTGSDAVLQRPCYISFAKQVWELIPWLFNSSLAESFGKGQETSHLTWELIYKSFAKDQSLSKVACAIRNSRTNSSSRTWSISVAAWKTVKKRDGIDWIFTDWRLELPCTKQSLSVSFIYGLDQSLKSSFERSTDNGYSSELYWTSLLCCILVFYPFIFIPKN